MPFSFLVLLTAILPNLEKPAATYRGGSLSFEQLDRFIGRAKRWSRDGQEAMSHLAQLRFVDEEARRRGLEITDAEWKASAQALADKGALAHVEHEAGKRVLRAYLLLDKLTAEDLGLGKRERTTSAQQSLWLEEMASGLKVGAPDPRARHAGVILGDPVPWHELGATLRARLEPDKLRDLIVDAVEEALIHKRARETQIRLAPEDIDREIARRRAALKANPRFAKTTLEEILEQQGRDPRGLRHDPALRMWALWAKVVRSKRPETTWRSLYRKRKAYWDRELGEQRRYSRIVYPIDPTRPRREAIARATQELGLLKAQIERGLAFPKAAEAFSKERATAQLGGQVVGWYTHHRALLEGIEKPLADAIFDSERNTVSGPITLARRVVLIHVDAIKRPPSEDGMIAEMQRYAAVQERQKLLRDAAIKTHLDQ